MRSSEYINTQARSSSTGTEMIYAPKAKGDRHRLHILNGHGSAGMECDHKTCRHRMRGGWLAPTLHIWYVTSGYMIRWKRVSMADRKYGGANSK